MRYVQWADGVEEATTDEIHPFDPELLPHYLRHTFGKNSGFAPERLEVNGRKGRRVVCVLGQDRLHYKIFDLDSSAEEDSGNEEGEESAGNEGGNDDDDAMSS